MAGQFAERPWYTSGSTLVLSRLTAPRAVLLGDAAHAVSAAFGQGVNSALEARLRPSPATWSFSHALIMRREDLLMSGSVQRDNATARMIGTAPVGCSNCPISFMSLCDSGSSDASCSANYSSGMLSCSGLPKITWRIQREQGSIGN